MKKLVLLYFAIIGGLSGFSQTLLPENIRPNPYLYVIYRFYLINRVFPESDISPVFDDDVIINQSLHYDELIMSVDNKTDKPITLILKEGTLIISDVAYDILYEMNGYFVNFPIRIPPYSKSPGIIISTSRPMFYMGRLKEAAKRYGIGAPEAVSHLTLEFPIMIDGERRPYKLEYEVMWIDGKYKRQHGYKRDRNQTWVYRYNTKNPMDL